MSQAAFKQLSADWAQDRSVQSAAMAAREEESALAKAALAEQAEMRAAVTAARVQAAECEQACKLKTECVPGSRESRAFLCSFEAEVQM